MTQEAYENLQIIWDYMHLNVPLTTADCIVGFGNYCEEIAVRSAQLYTDGYAPKVLFTGGLGRNTDHMWQESEARRFAKIAIEHGVLEDDLIIEDQSTNTGENIQFTKEKFASLGMDIKSMIGVHQPCMERRIYAALQVYWPEIKAMITSPQLTVEEYIHTSMKQGLSEHRVIEVMVGDYQRIDVYARKGYQIPQVIPEEVEKAFEHMVTLGYIGQLIQE